MKSSDLGTKQVLACKLTGFVWCSEGEVWIKFDAVVEVVVEKYDLTVAEVHDVDVVVAGVVAVGVAAAVVAVDAWASPFLPPVDVVESPVVVGPVLACPIEVLVLPPMDLDFLPSKDCHDLFLL